jgi:hypothetical protein
MIYAAVHNNEIISYGDDLLKVRIEIQEYFRRGDYIGFESLFDERAVEKHTTNQGDVLVFSLWI